MARSPQPAPLRWGASSVDELETCGRLGELEEPLDGRRPGDEAEGESVGPRVCVPLQDHPQPGRVEEGNLAEVERHLLEAGRLQLAQVRFDHGNCGQVELAYGGYADPLPLGCDLAAETLAS